MTVQLDSFVGREHEVAEGLRLLADGRMVSLVGPGGVGKTRMAAHLANYLSEAGTRVWVIDWCSAGPGGNDPAQLVAAVVGARELPGTELVESIAAALGAGPGLLLLDNCEKVVDLAAKLSDRLLRNCPGIKILTTSQEALGVPGEVVYGLKGLDMSPQGGAESAAVRLFVDRATQIRPDFVPGPRVRDICARLDGMPLYIELAARWVSVLSVTEILAQLDEDRLGMLSVAPRTSADRHRSLRAVIGQSYELLSTREQAAFRRLALLPGGFGLDAAVAVCGPGFGRAEVLQLVHQLQAKSLVVVDDSDPCGLARFTMIASIRLYGEHVLRERGEFSSCQDRVVEWLTTLCGPVAEVDRLTYPLRLIRSLLLERDNLSFAVSRVTEGPRMLLLCALAVCWGQLGWRSRVAELLAGIDHTTVEDPAEQCMILYVRSRAAREVQNYALSERFAAELLGVAGAAGLEVQRIRALGSLSHAIRQSGETAGDYEEQSLRASIAHGDPEIVAWCKHAVAEMMIRTGEHARAAVLLDEVMSSLKRLGIERQELWFVLHTRGVLAVEADDLAVAERDFRDALAVATGDVGLGRESLLGLIRTAAARTDVVRFLRLSAALDKLPGHPAPLHSVAARTREFAKQFSVALAPEKRRRVDASARARTLEQLLAYAVDGVWPEQPDNNPGSPLSARELEVARLVADGLSNRQIALELRLSPRTVDAHLDHIRAKLEIRSRAQIGSWLASLEA
jgi:predicted ATPase/DNA-binding CsgD family transcriptional regulator